MWPFDVFELVLVINHKLKKMQKVRFTSPIFSQNYLSIDKSLESIL